MRREGAAAGMEICSSICYNYPTLLAMMIILLRVDFVCPLALFTASFQKVEWWINKNFAPAGSLNGMWHGLSISLPLPIWLLCSLAHLFTGKITSTTSTFSWVNIGKRCNQQNWGEALYFVHFNSPMTSRVNSKISPVCASVCMLWQGDCLVIRAVSSARFGRKRPTLSVSISSLSARTRHLISPSHPVLRDLRNMSFSQC